MTIDEIQYAPQLFSAIKIIVDREKPNGLFWLTGSQKFHLMRGITESLAGRVAIVDLLGLAQAELTGRAAASRPFIPTPQWLAHARQSAQDSAPSHGLKEIYQQIWLGSYPRLIAQGAQARDVEVDNKTAKSWLSILETSGLVYLLQPYHRNLTKRLVKTPKLYFLDTGLAAYLTMKARSCWP